MCACYMYTSIHICTSPIYMRIYIDIHTHIHIYKPLFKKQLVTLVHDTASYYWLKWVRTLI